MVDLGHEVIEFDYDLRSTFQNVDPAISRQRTFIDKNRPKVTQSLLRQIRTAHSQKPLDLFFSYFYDACVLPGAIDEIRSMGIRTLNWYCNGSYQLHLVREISPHYDWCLVPEKFRIDDYIAMGARPIYCQEAANPNIYKPFDLPREFDVTFVGQAYGDRPIHVRKLLDSGIDIRVWGYGWEKYSTGPGRMLRGVLYGAEEMLRRWARNDTTQRLLGWEPRVEIPRDVLGGVLSDTEMINMYSRSKINLGFSSCGETHRTGEKVLQVRLRDFEVPMCGGFYLVEYMEELEDFFDIGKEIVCYKGPEDLVEKIKYYLRHDQDRDVIREAGRRRCLRDHTWHKRFDLVFKKIGLA